MEDGRYGNHRRSPPQILPKPPTDGISDFPDRGTTKIILTVTNRLGETKNGGKDAADNIHRQDAGLLQDVRRVRRNRIRIPEEQRSRITLRSDSIPDAACTRRIASTENTIECSYILWDDYYDIDSEPVSSTIQEQGTFLIPVGSSTCELPHDIFNGTPYTFGPTYIPIRNNRILLQNKFGLDPAGYPYISESIRGWMRHKTTASVLANFAP